MISDILLIISSRIVLFKHVTYFDRFVQIYLIDNIWAFNFKNEVIFTSFNDLFLHYRNRNIILDHFELFSFDFNPVLNTGETLSTATCTAVTIQGTDPDPSAVLSGSPVISLGKATQRIVGGINENIYRLIMTCTTSLGNTYTCTGDIPVYAPTAN
jgi:hypothetical protein